MKKIFLVLFIIGLSMMFYSMICFGQDLDKKSDNPAASEKKEETNKQLSVLDTIIEAHNKESNAKEMFTAFAKKADEEGYVQLGSLFRAAARSAETHIKFFDEQIKSMKGTPKNEVKKPEVKTSKENLQAAINWSDTESSSYYKELIENAKRAKEKSVVRFFKFSMETNKSQAKFFKDALENLDEWKVAKKEFFVCTVCGYVENKKPKLGCPECYNPPKVFVNVK